MRQFKNYFFVVKKISLSFCFSVLFSVANAEPTASVRALMSQEVSLFSFGLYQLNQKVNEQKIDELRGWSSVFYKWNTNRIHVSFREIPVRGYCQKKDDARCRSMCERQYTKLRELLCFGEDCEVHSAFAHYFSHIGYSRDVVDRKSDSEVAQSLKDITEVSVYLSLSDDPSKTLVCEGPITREKPSFRVETK